MKKFILVLLIVAILLGAGEYFGIIQHNKLFTFSYDVKGIDVSHWQNDINWDDVSTERVDFAFIKATEGNDYVDNMFKYNWEEAERVGIKRGAYHYFTIGSSGKEQAENFIRIVPNDDNSLPPVIDIEVGGLSKEEFNKELDDFIQMVEEHYNKKPILYVVYSLYDNYIAEEYADYNIWIRDIVKPPKLSDGREWALWQYSNRGRLKGISTYVDLNVANIRVEDF